MDNCMECGFVYDWVGRDSVADRLRSLRPRFTAALAASNKLAHKRPQPDVWSAVEYTCHVRDTFLSQRERLYLTLVEDEPGFPPMYRDRRVHLAHYNEEPLPQVIDELAFAARLIGDAFAGLDEDQWLRTCIYNYPTPATRSLLWLGQHMIHEGEHHLLDVTHALTDLGPHSS